MTEAEFVGRLREWLASSYELGPEIGRGGTAIVYRATDLSRHRPVALKVLKPEVSALVGGERFLREIEIAASLQHPNIVPVYDSGRANGHLFYVMPLIEGTSLRERVKDHGALAIDDAVLIASEVGDALAYAHEHGVVHRDIKPGNILLTSHHALVADFGVACAMAGVDSSRLTESGIVVGTPAYMSPEQAGGEQEIDGRCDVYALGCVLFEMLAGEPPFTGRTTQAVLARHLLEPAPSVKVVRPNVPPCLAETVRRSLEKLPADRFDSAETFVQALESGEVPTSRPRRRARRRRWAALAALGLVVAGVAWLATRSPVPRLDAASIVLFPLAAETEGPDRLTLGTEAMLLVDASLQYVPGLRTVNGSRLLSERQSRSLELMTPQAAMRIASAAGSRYALVGVIRTRGDRQEVTLSLLDAEGDSALSVATADHATDSVPPTWTALAAADELWRSQAAFQTPDLGTLTARDPVAVEALARGLRQYREASFVAALSSFGEAIDADSALALAAFKGGQAAVWLEGSEVSEEYALQLFEMSLQAPDLLPEKYAFAARGFEHYVRGNADSAALWHRRALHADSAWAEGWLALGEVYYHLLPPEGPLDSLAEHALRRAVELDPELSPTLFHLAEIGIRQGRLDQADSLLQAYRSFNPDSFELRQLELMINCARERSASLEWTETLDAGHSLASGGYHPWCAEQAFRAVLAAENPPPGHEWAAILGVQALLVAQGRIREASAFLDSVVAAGLSPARPLFVHAALAGGGADSVAARIVELGKDRFGPDFVGVYPPWLWMFGAWFARQGDVETVERVHASLEAAASTEGADPQVQVYADAVAGHLALARGDTAGAIRRFQALQPRALLGSLAWGEADALAHERVVLARLLYAQGDYEDAYRVAKALDHVTPIMFVQYLPISLALRYRIANRLGWRERAVRLEQRLVRLGREDLIAPPDAHPSQGD